MTAEEPSSSHLSTLKLHQLRYGELDPSERSAARAHLAECPRCVARLAVQEQNRAAFVAQPVPPALRAHRAGARTGTGAGVREQARPPRSGLSLLWRGGLVAALLLALWLVPGRRPADDTIRLRGAAPDVEVWVDVGDGPRAHREGEALAAGDRVQLKFDPRGAAYATLAGRDRTGETEIYGTFAVEGDGGLANVPFALELDHVGGTQEFFVILAEEAPDSATVEEVVRRYPDPVPGLHVHRATVDKTSREEVEAP